MFVRIWQPSRMKNMLLLVVTAAAGSMLLLWPEGVATGVSRGLSVCGSVLIPSLFPFLVLSGFLVRSGLAAMLGRRLERVTRVLFGLPGCCGAAILVSMVGGYPAGGMAVGELVQEGAITPAQGKRMLRFCVNGGPAFIISAVGAGMLGSVRRGVMLYAAHIAVALLLGIAGRRGSAQETAVRRCAVRRQPLSAAFVESVNGACRSLLYMCGFVILFAAVLSLADASGFAVWFWQMISRPVVWLGGDDTPWRCVLPCLLEVSCGCVEAAGSGLGAMFALGAALGWGGLSVHCQLAASLSEERLIDGGFFVARAWQGLLGGVVSVLVFRFVPMPLEVVTLQGGAVLQPTASTAPAAVALLLMCAVFMLSERGGSHRL